MEDTEFYGQLLGLPEPWRVRKVALDIAAGRVDVWVEEAVGTKWNCPECGQGAPLYKQMAKRLLRRERRGIVLI